MTIQWFTITLVYNKPDVPPENHRVTDSSLLDPAEQAVNDYIYSALNIPACGGYFARGGGHMPRRLRFRKDGSAIARLFVKTSLPIEYLQGTWRFGRVQIKAGRR